MGIRSDNRAKFCQLAKSGQLESLLERHSTFNLPFITAGGKVFWDTLEVDGWKLQTNGIFGNWRILDSGDIRLAWGRNEEQLESFLNNRPTSMLANYFDDGYSFSKYQAENQPIGSVVLIHGWGVRAVSMQGLAKELATNGYNALNYDYPSSFLNIRGQANGFLRIFRQEKPEGKLWFLTHSMGALVLRAALEKMDEEECRAISGIVMLGPPNRGSLLAILGDNALVREFNSSLGDMAPGADTLNFTIPKVVPPIGIIAGDFDGKVAFEDTAMPNGMPFSRIRVSCTHPGLRNPNNTMKQILEFFKYNRFS